MYTIKALASLRFFLKIIQGVTFFDVSIIRLSHKLLFCRVCDSGECYYWNGWLLINLKLIF